MDNLNSINLDLQGVNVNIEDEDQTLNLICSLSNSYTNFVDTIFYGRTKITVNYVKDSLMTKELKRNFSVGEEVSSFSLFLAIGRTSYRGGGNKGKSSFESKANLKCYN